MRFDMKVTHLWADKASGVRGTPCSRKYSGLAQQMKVTVPIRRATKLESGCSPMRTTQSTPSSSRCTGKARPSSSADRVSARMREALE